FRVATADALDFWDIRLSTEGVTTSRVDGELRFTDPEGLGLALVVDQSGDAPLRGRHPEIPAAHELLGFDHVVAYGGRLNGTKAILEDVLGATAVDDSTWLLRGTERGGTIRFEAPPAHGAKPGGGT